MEKDYYKILGLERQASAEEIKKAFHKKAHQYHPDKNGGDANKFKEINEAYQVLGNAQKRSQYDQFGSTFSQNNGFGNAHGGFSGFEGVNINMDDLGDIFGGFGDIFGFSGRNRGRQSSRGRDIEVILTISFTEAVFGVEKEIKLNKLNTCNHCQGQGAEPGSQVKTCSTCRGSGKVSKIQRTILGAMQVQTVCPDCQGEGKTYSKVCTKCSGQGVVRQAVELKIKIPAGIDNGETLRLSEQGEAGVKGAPAGDLYVKVQVEPSQEFKRQGYNILSTATLSLSQAILGDKIDIKTIHGLVSLKIPSGTQSGKTFILKNKGVTKLQGRGQGDHLVTVKVDIPSNLSRSQKKIVEELKVSGL